MVIGQIANYNGGGYIVADIDAKYGTCLLLDPGFVGIYNVNGINVKGGDLQTIEKNGETIVISGGVDEVGYADVLCSDVELLADTADSYNDVTMFA